MKKKFLRSVVVALAGSGLLAGNAFALPFNDRDQVMGPLPALQAILDDFTAPGSSLDAVKDQNNEAVWVRSGDWDVDVVRVAVYSGNSTNYDLGIYSFIDPAKKYVFENLNEAGSSANFKIARSGNLYVNNTAAIESFGEQFGFFVTNGIEYYYTEDDKNGGVAHSFVYDLDNIHYRIPYMSDIIDGIGGPDDRMVIIDGAPYFMEDIAPIPEPATMLLFGMGLASFAGLVRRKKH